MGSPGVSRAELLNKEHLFSRELWAGDKVAGLPPKDLWEDVTLAWARAGLNVPDCWKRACSVTNEWCYDDQPTKPLKSRITQRLITERSIPLKNRTLSEVLDPQPEASVVFKRLLDCTSSIQVVNYDFCW